MKLYCPQLLEGTVPWIWSVRSGRLLKSLVTPHRSWVARLFVLMEEAGIFVHNHLLITTSCATTVNR